MNNMIEELYNSRYGNKRYLKKISKKEYLIYGKSHFCRWLGDDLGTPTSIDFEGGPFLSVGDNLKDFGSSKDLIVVGLRNYKNTEDLPCFKIIVE